MEGRIFISYSRKDLDKVKPIKEELEATGFSCWMDLEGIESGSEEFTEYIANAIEQSRVLLFFLSGTSQKSRWSLNELRVARDDKKHVVLIRFNSDKMTTKFRLEFGGADIIDWRRQEQKAKLLKDLKRWLKCGASSAKVGNSPVPLKSIGLGTADSNESVGTIVQRPEDVVLGDDKVEAEKVFVSRARRFKMDDGVIDPSERKELDWLAERLGISILRREALIEQVECALGRENNVVQVSSPSSVPKSRAKAPTAVSSSGTGTSEDSRTERIISFCEGERHRASWEDLYVGDGIPAEKLVNFREAVASRGPDERGILLADPIALCDATVFGSAKNGFLLTEKGISVSGDWSAKTSAGYLSWEEFISPGGTVLFEGSYEILLYSARGRSVFFNAAACGRDVQDVVGFFRRLREVAGARQSSSSSALRIVTEAFANVRSDRFWIGEKIPPVKEGNARKSMNIGNQAVFALYDDTVWGGSREGFVVVASGLFFKNISEDPVFIPWTNVGNISVAKGALFVGENKIECGDSSLDLPAKHAVAAGLRLLAERSANLADGECFDS